MKTSGKLAGLVAGAIIGFSGCSLSYNPNFSNKDDKYSLENILPDNYKSMKLEHLGTTEPVSLGKDESLTEEGFVTSIYRDKSKNLSTKKNLREVVRTADYSIIIMYQLCDGKKMPVRLYAPYDEKGSNWWFQEQKGFNGQFYRAEDLMAKYNDLVSKDSEKFKAMSQKERDAVKVSIIKPTFANCGMEIRGQGNHHHGEGHNHGKGHGKGDYHKSKKRIAQEYS